MTQNYLPWLLFGSLMLRSFNPSACSLKNSISFGLFSPESFSSYTSTHMEFCVHKKERNFPDFLIFPERSNSFFLSLGWISTAQIQPQEMSTNLLNWGQKKQKRDKFPLGISAMAWAGKFGLQPENSVKSRGASWTSTCNESVNEPPWKGHLGKGWDPSQRPQGSNPAPENSRREFNPENYTGSHNSSLQSIKTSRIHRALNQKAIK